MKKALVLGAGGFIGTHLVRRLKREGYWVRGVDLEYPEFSKTEADEFVLCDLRSDICTRSVIVDKYNEPFHKPTTFDEVYQLAADMGGCQYIFTGDNDADIMTNSAMINLNVLYELRKAGFTGKIFYSSSACMYPQEIQNKYGSFALSESDAYPANPDSEYGWEKLFSERLYASYARNYKFNIRVARLHNVYGPESKYKGGKEKAPASISRKVAEAAEFVERWGDGSQIRSFLYIDDCIEAIRRLMESEYSSPINIGSEEFVSIKKLWEVAALCRRIADPQGPNLTIGEIEAPKNVKGVEARSSNNTLMREQLGWEPQVPLLVGMQATYNWIKSQIYGV